VVPTPTTETGLTTKPTEPMTVTSPVRNFIDFQVDESTSKSMKEPTTNPLTELGPMEDPMAEALLTTMPVSCTR
jgi:hypothetical protein